MALPHPMTDPARGYTDKIRWIEVTNYSGEDIPGGALLRTTGSDSDGRVTVDKPDEDGQSHLMIAHAAGVKTDGTGWATYTDLVPALYDDADTPAVNDTWGSEADDWKLHKDQAGYRVAADPSSTNGMKLVEVQRDQGGGEEAGDKIFNICLDAGATGSMVVLKPDGTTECVPIPECPEEGCPPLWYCVDGAVLEVDVGDTPPGGDVVSGPYRTEAEAAAACPSGSWWCVDGRVEQTDGFAPPFDNYRNGPFATESEAIASCESTALECGCGGDPEPLPSRRVRFNLSNMVSGSAPGSGTWTLAAATAEGDIYFVSTSGGFTNFAAVVPLPVTYNPLLPAFAEGMPVPVGRVDIQRNDATGVCSFSAGFSKLDRPWHGYGFSYRFTDGGLGGSNCTVVLNSFSATTFVTPTAVGIGEVDVCDGTGFPYPPGGRVMSGVYAMSWNTCGYDLTCDAMRANGDSGLAPTTGGTAVGGCGGNVVQNGFSLTATVEFI
jgi:hypothetical protein